MKLSHTFIVVIIVLMAVMLLFETNAPNRFNWDDVSQSNLSKQPFGCYVMDSVLRASLPQGYKVIGVNHNVRSDTALMGKRHTYLFTNNLDDFLDLQDVDFLELIEKGNNVLIAADHSNDYWGDDVEKIEEKLGYSFNWTNSQYYSKATLSDSKLMDTINWCLGGRTGSTTYLINQAFCQKELALTSPYRTLATLNRDSYYYSETYEPYTFIVAGVRDYGKGRVVVVTMPLVFSNYGILNDTIRPFALRLLSECGDAPVVRYDRTLHEKNDSADGEQDSGSPLRYLLKNRPLRWAFFLALATLVAFVAFSARRRQRVIPVIKPPVNHMMDFVKRIGDIYFQRHDNVDLLIKKYVTFSNDVRSKTMIDIDNYDHIDEELQSLSSRTGIPFPELKQQIYDVWSATHADSISNERLKKLIDVMNDILRKIYI